MSKPTDGSGNKRKLSDIQLDDTVTREQVTKIWGPPDNRLGSGIDYWAYSLQNGEAVWFTFMPDPPFHLVGAILVSPKTGSRTRLFGK